MSLGMHVKSLTRINTLGEEESIEFDAGVNLLVGPSNSGKTVWLMMLDFLLGAAAAVEDKLDRDDTEGNRLFDIYQELKAVIEINGVEYLVQRKWKEKGQKMKIIVDGQALDPSTFSKFILEQLAIPVLKFPKGNPYQDGSWVELTFRILFRHMYRQERFWNDLADKQPEGEQHAALCQFLGLADGLFAPTSNELIDKRKELNQLQTQKEQFQQVLDQITKRLMPAGEKGDVFVTVDTLKERINQLQEQVNSLLDQRRNTIADGLQKALTHKEQNQSIEIKLTQDRAAIVQEIETLTETQQRLQDKQHRFQYLLKTVESEHGKLSRAKTAGDLLADIKITHCPACDQSVREKKQEEHTCFLCHQPLTPQENEERVDFELHQLDNERKELSEMLGRLEHERTNDKTRIALLSDSLATIDRQLAPLKQTLSGLVQAQVSALDLQRGKVEEQIDSYKRILTTLHYRDDLSQKIDDLTTQIQSQTAQTTTISDSLDFEQVTDDLTDGMMEYINQIVDGNFERWPFPNDSRIRLYLTERRFHFRIGRSNWASVGATIRTYFLLAYHYGLLKLSLSNEYHYPRLLIIDFPPVLADIDLSTAENYLIKPFTQLSTSTQNQVQVIIAGRAFDGLTDVHTIELADSYK